jgi:hypothetical protein
MDDTNGNGIADRDENSVKATDKGRDEVDLAKTELKVYSPEEGEAILIKSGENKAVIKLWKHKTKEEEIKPTNPPDTWKFNVGQGNEWKKTVWIEIGRIEPQNLRMQGITFTLKYKGREDEASLTGIWAIATMKHNDGDPLWEDMGDRNHTRVRDSINEYGRFGVRPNRVINNFTHIRNVMGMQFVIYPNEIVGVDRVKFDITRQIGTFKSIFVGKR